MVDVWRVRVDAENRWLDEHWSRLGRAERWRAVQFHHTLDRHRFAMARSTLRALLCQTLGVPDHELQFAVTAQGKPVLAPPGKALHFNSSHSGRWIVHALCRDGPVGVDVEAVRPEFGAPEDFDFVLAPDEQRALAALPPGQRARAFTTLWVRKEAYVKALGAGLSRSMKDIGVGMPPDSAGAVIDRHHQHGAPRDWTYHDIPFGADFAGCVVTRGRRPTVHVHEFPGLAMPELATLIS